MVYCHFSFAFCLSLAFCSLLLALHCEMGKSCLLGLPLVLSYILDAVIGVCFPFAIGVFGRLQNSIAA